LAQAQPNPMEMVLSLKCVALSWPEHLLLFVSLLTISL